MSKNNKRNRKRKAQVTKHENQGTYSLSAEYQEEFVGPLPPPSALAEYNAIVPGSADIIINQFVAQGEHRRELEAYVVKGDSRRANWGLAAGFIVSVGTIAGGFYLTSIGSMNEGLSVIIGSIVTLAGVFIYGTERRRSERKQKAELTKR